MVLETRAATVFDDVRQLLGPKRPDATVCWCLSYRVPSRLNRELRGDDRGEYVRELCERAVAPGVLAYDDGVPVGWAAVAPRSEVHSFARANSKVPHLDDAPVWTVWCFRVRPGHRGQGVLHALLAAAVDFARDHGAPAIEGYPVDNGDARVDQVMAYTGTRRLFEAGGFILARDLGYPLGGFPRVVMRKSLVP